MLSFQLDTWLDSAPLSPTEQQFRDVADTIPQMLFSALPNGDQAFCNKCWQEFTGLSAGRPPAHEDGGQPDRWSMWHPDDRAAVAARWEHDVATGTPFEGQYRLRHHDGDHRWVVVRAAPVRNEAGEIIRWMGSCTDVQQFAQAREELVAIQTELERRVADRTAQLRRINARLVSEMRRREAAQAAVVQSQKMEALGQLTSSVAHDFNNVIAAIAGGFSVIEARSKDAMLTDVARHGARAASRGALLIKQLLAYARQQSTQPERIGLAAFFEDADGLIRRSAGPLVDVCVECPPGIWPIYADPVQLEAALVNLVVNARDAMPEGGAVTLYARPCPMGMPDRPAELAGADAVMIAVADNGCGMPPDVLQRVVEPFFTTKDHGKGTGLGLAMANSFAQQSGGALRIESRVGHGTTVALFLPSAEDMLPGAADGDMLAIGSDAAQHGYATLLLADPDDDLREITAASLRDLAYKVISVDNAAAALEALRREPLIDAVVADASLRCPDRTALAAAIRLDHPAVPVLLLTSHADRHRAEGGPVVEKPFTPQLLAGRLLNLLGRTSMAATLSDEMLDRLFNRVRAVPLKRTLQRWRESKVSDGEPKLDDMGLDELLQSPNPPHARFAVLSVDMGKVPISFHVDNASLGLSEADGRPLAGTDVAVVGEDALGSREAAYRRCALSGRPSYEYARFTLGEDQPVMFERLLLPFYSAGPGSPVATLLSVVTLAGIGGDLAA